ncbi:MAG: carboxylating nicotinate-nucleotide diphosphorylase [Candidatus Bathyarchaeia archaeon]
MKKSDVFLEEELLKFLKEDVGLGDITTEAVIPEKSEIRAQIIVKEPAVVAGILEVKALFEMVGTLVACLVEDGDEVRPRTVVAEIEGDARSILTAERTALNILMRMSGIATATRKLVRKIKDAGFNTRIAATRKTAPGLRYFDKKAVMIGGGDPHRFRLDDAVLIKDNHIMIAGGIEEAIKRVRAVVSFSKKIEVEAKTVAQAIAAAKLGADIIMLDNMTVKEFEETMETLETLDLRDKVLIEISGNINEENILEYAKLEPDVISLGSLTHSVKAVDVSLEVVEVKTQ